MKLNWRLALPIGVVVVATLAIWVMTRPAQVEVAEVRRGDLVASLAATGIVEVYQAEVSPEVVGRVTAVMVEEGEPVRSGDLLARLESAEEQAGLAQQQAALAVSRAEAAQVAAALSQERSASRARIAGAEAGLRVVKARLRDLEAGARPREIESAGQSVAAARAQARLARDDYRRIRDLYQKGAVSRADQDQAETRMDTAEAALRQAIENLALVKEGARPAQTAAAKAEVEAAQAELEAAQASAGQVAVWKRNLAAAQARVALAQGALAQAESSLGKTEVLSPFTGWVARRYVDVGDLGSPGSPLFLITDNSNVWVTAEVDEEDVNLVYKGQKVQVTAQALERPIEGTVVQVGRAAFPRGLQQVRAKIVRCKVQLGGGGETLRSGMEVDVRGSRRLAADKLLIPLEALVESQGEHFAWVARGGKVRRQKIEVGRRTYEEAQVLSGLEKGEKVVVSGSRGLKEGARVKASRSGSA